MSDSNIIQFMIIIIIIIIIIIYINMYVDFFLFSFCLSIEVKLEILSFYHYIHTNEHIYLRVYQNQVHEQVWTSIKFSKVV